MAELWERLLGRPEVSQLAQDATDLYARVWIVMEEDERHPTLDSLLPPYWCACDRLAELAAQLEPDLAHFHGPELRDAVHRLIAGRVVEHFKGRAAVERVAEQLPPLHIHGLPGTPIRFDGRNAIVPEATPKEQALLAIDVMQSYQPAGRRGRPHGTSRTTETEARQAWALRKGGADWRDIAEALWGRRPDPDDLDFEAVQSRVRRRLKLGKGLAATN